MGGRLSNPPSDFVLNEKVDAKNERLKFVLNF